MLSFLFNCFLIIPCSFVFVIENLNLCIFGCSGDTDAVVPVTATRYSIDALKLPTIINWYPWYDSGKVGATSIINKLSHETDTHVIFFIFIFCCT